ncbi:lipid A deacylase LpxR family protein [Roseomonas haemaphysalidis]|uniref:Lipid A deacylase LpxR family protein n=1 Tax=Roseomonas haemaphysalidis TaxID=2768162 RepID=A0ABS3KT86_9PROT|nr:lipid A deacylase LpxR family protein [Roseomonas haemaphysalidis]MBO1079521.1 lipid A deacylase LpxR family protein [Roseomonas haemaphysalidis]
MRQTPPLLLSLMLTAGMATGAVAQGLAPATTAAPPVIAPDQAPPPDPYGTLTFATENDVFGGGTDRYYTNGLLLSYRSPSADLPRPLAWLNDQLEWVLGPGTLRWGAAVGQNIYTPQDTYRSNPDPRDRPYAGYLYGSVSLSRITELTSRTVELQLGVVGPAALGEQVQNNYHRLLNIRRVDGWDYQLKDEAAVTAIYEQKWRVPMGTVAGLQTEVVPSVSASIGNVQTYAAAGGTVRIGHGLDSDFGPPRIRPGLSGSGWVQPRENFEWYVFAGLEGRAVGRDIFLDGNTFRDSRSVDKRIFVGDFQTGVAAVYRGVRVALTQVWRSEEFYGQSGRQKFGSLSVSFRF